MNTQPEPTFDTLGYPSDASLEIIRNWPVENKHRALMAFVEKLWKYPEYWNEQKTITNTHYEFEYTISTGGWSGNEELVRALYDNTMFWVSCWTRSERGGRYVFTVKECL